MARRVEREVERFLFQSRQRSTEWSEDFCLGYRRSCETGRVVLVGNEELDTVVRGDSADSRGIGEANGDRGRRADALQAAAGIWRDRTDLPDFGEVRHSWDRS